VAVWADDVGNDVDNLAAGGDSMTLLLRARALQRVDETMVGFWVDDVVRNAKTE
jgi:hypothetical protein